MPKTPADIRSLCRAFTDETVQIIAGIARAKETPPAVRVQAIAMLWDRGWGKPAQAHTGADGEGDIRVTIRTFVEGRDVEPRVIEHENKQIEVVQNDADEP